MKRMLILVAATAAQLVCSDASACQRVRRALRGTDSIASRAVKVVRAVKAPLRVLKPLRRACR